MSHPEKAAQATINRVLVTIWRFINQNVLTQVLSAILSLIIVARVTNWWTGPQFYRVYVVGSFNPSEETTQEVWQGFTAKGDRKASMDGVSVVTDRENDAGDPKEAQKVAAELARRSDTLMVIGHVLSTQTRAALPYYLDIEQPIPVILTTETNPTLLRLSALPPNSPDDDPYPVFRLSPTDDEQAAIAAEYAIGQRGGGNFWIVKDTDNPTYSDYLASEFQNRVVAAGKHVVMATTTDTSPNPGELKARNIDWVFFAGDEAHAMILIDQIHRVGDARTAIRSIMNERHTFQTPDINYKFDHEGKSAANGFHIWQIRGGKFVECEEDGSCK